ncbi:MAG: Holliday junction resolvase RuvX [Dehalococcoidia bacterium]|nr:Holliday junction resolvase RuvX [Dehalococcoidia bacterium]
MLGLDVGDRRIGLAISDPNGQVAVPLRTLHRTAQDGAVDAIAALVAEENVEAIVVGLPLRLDGSAGSQAESVQEFVRQLLPAVNVPVTLWDERLSTVQAEQLLRRDGPPSRKGKAERDSLAAAIILQGYLDSRPGRQAE